MLLSETAENSGRLETLRALRQKLAEALDESKSGRDIASLALQLQKVLLQIEEIETAEANDTDELQAIVDECKDRQTRPRRRGDH